MTIKTTTRHTPIVNTRPAPKAATPTTRRAPISPPPPTTPPQRGAAPGAHAAWVDNLAAPAKAPAPKTGPVALYPGAAATALRNQTPARPTGHHKIAHRAPGR